MTTLDFDSLNDAIEVRRMELGLSWEALAVELRVELTELRELNEASHMGVVFRAIDWTGLDIDDFLAEEAGDHDQDTADRAEHVAAFLRADRDLKPESAEAIEAVLRAAYDRFAAA